MFKLTTALIGALALAGGSATAQQLSPNGVKTLSPAGAIKPTGTWNLATRAGDFIFIAGMRGIDPKTNALVPGDEARIRQAFVNMRLIAEAEGVTLKDAVRLVVFVTDMFRFRPLVNKVQTELWGERPIRRAPLSRSIGSIRMTSWKSKEPFTRLPVNATHRLTRTDRVGWPVSRHPSGSCSSKLRCRPTGFPAKP
jgi:2-iminobutanoate/2-iminopropanoate deaminase